MKPYIADMGGLKGGVNRENWLASKLLKSARCDLLKLV